MYEFACVSCVFRHTYTWNSTHGGRGIPYRVPCWPRLFSPSLLLVLVLFRPRTQQPKCVYTDNLLSSLPTSFTTDKRSFRPSPMSFLGRLSPKTENSSRTRRTPPSAYIEFDRTRRMSKDPREIWKISISGPAVVNRARTRARSWSIFRNRLVAFVEQPRDRSYL